MSTNPDAKNFEAWLDKQPGANDTLHVKGKLTVPTLGWTATLTERKPPGINLTILELELKKVKPTHPAGDKVSEIEVTFKKPHSPEYKEVTIHGDGSHFTIPVKIIV